jgi:serine/threonine protein kinase
MRVVGRGAFGKVGNLAHNMETPPIKIKNCVYRLFCLQVRIVERRDTKVLYALKYISKHDCIQMDAVRNVIRERVMLEQLDHPFICRLRFAFQDDEYMYMVMDLM